MAELPRGSGQLCPGRCRLRKVPKRLPWRCRFRRSSPCRLPDRYCDRLSLRRISCSRVPCRLAVVTYFFFFFAAFLAFLFFAITGLHQRLRKENTKPVRTATVYSIAGMSPGGSNSFASRQGERAARKKNLRSIYRDHRKKYFRRITHNQESSKNYFAAKRRSPKHWSWVSGRGRRKHSAQNHLETDVVALRGLRSKTCDAFRDLRRYALARWPLRITRRQSSPPERSIQHS